MKEKKYTRNCPECGRKLYYKTKATLYNAENKKSRCRFCANGGRTHSEETKKKIGKGVLNSEKWWNACPRNPEWRKKISETEKGKIVSDETKEKLRLSHLGQVVSPETREKLRQTSKKAWRDGKFDKMVQKTMSKSSQKFLNRIEDEFGIEFDDREFPVEDKYYDAKYKNILIEVDSKYWHRLPEHIENDKLKNKIAKRNGYKLYRFEVNTEKEVTEVFNKNKKTISNLLDI